MPRQKTPRIILPSKNALEGTIEAFEMQHTFTTKSGSTETISLILLDAGGTPVAKNLCLTYFPASLHPDIIGMEAYYHIPSRGEGSLEKGIIGFSLKVHPTRDMLHARYYNRVFEPGQKELAEEIQKTAGKFLKEYHYFKYQ